MTSKNNRINLLRFEKRSDGKFDYNLLIFMIVIHLAALVGSYYFFTGKCGLVTYIWTIIMFLLGGFGIGGSAHRYFSHKSYKTTYAFKLFLIFCHQLSGQSNILFWCRVHRVHHKYTDTDKDPTDIRRGFFFGYIAWYWMPPTPEAQKEMEIVNLDDLLNDEEVMFQYRHAEILFVLITILFPTMVPYLLWNEQFHVGLWLNFFRIGLNFTQQNIGSSFLHWNGAKPYDESLTATDSKIWIFFTLGEGYHNYHHVFPFDYRASEFSGYDSWNWSAWMIDFCSKFGWTYDRKIASPQMIQNRLMKEEQKKVNLNLTTSEEL